MNIFNDMEKLWIFFKFSFFLVRDVMHPDGTCNVGPT